MKKYLCPELDVVELKENDIITTSPGTETPVMDENGGIWDLDFGA